MKTALKYFVGINVKSDRRQVFGVHKQPTAASHGKHFSAVIGPFKNLRAALYVRDRGFNNPQIRCPADAERLCKVRCGPTYQRSAVKLKRRKGRARHSVRAVGKVAARGVQRTARPTARRKKGTRRARRAAPVRRRKNPRIDLPAWWNGKSAVGRRAILIKRRIPVNFAKFSFRELPELVTDALEAETGFRRNPLGGMFPRYKSSMAGWTKTGKAQYRHTSSKAEVKKTARGWEVIGSSNDGLAYSSMWAAMDAAAKTSIRRVNPARKLRRRKLSPAQLRAGFGGKRFKTNRKTKCK